MSSTDNDVEIYIFKLRDALMNRLVKIHTLRTKLTDCQRELAKCDETWQYCQKQLSEAQAALNDAKFHITEWSPTVHAEAWKLKHANAIKAAEEVQ